jgi:hypothetical protein
MPKTNVADYAGGRYRILTPEERHLLNPITLLARGDQLSLLFDMDLVLRLSDRKITPAEILKGMTPEEKWLYQSFAGRLRLSPRGMRGRLGEPSWVVYDAVRCMAARHLRDPQQYPRAAQLVLWSVRDFALSHIDLVEHLEVSQVA